MGHVESNAQGTCACTGHAWFWLVILPSRCARESWVGWLNDDSLTLRSKVRYTRIVSCMLVRTDSVCESGDNCFSLHLLARGR
jgi:hypothetical protein